MAVKLVAGIALHGFYYRSAVESMAAALRLPVDGRVSATSGLMQQLSGMMSVEGIVVSRAARFPVLLAAQRLADCPVSAPPLAGAV